MDLGTLISQLECEQNAADALSALGDLVLYADVLATGARFGESPAEYTAGAVGRFAEGANDEEWVTLLGAMERAPLPGQAFLAHAIRWALVRDRADEPGTTCCQCQANDQSPEPHHDQSP